MLDLTPPSCGTASGDGTGLAATPSGPGKLGPQSAGRKECDLFPFSSPTSRTVRGSLLQES